MLADESATQEAVDQAEKQLAEAIKGLEKVKENPPAPTKPSNPKPTNPSKPANGSNAGTNKNNGKASKTGDVTPIIPAAAGVILSMAAIVVVLKKRKR